MSTKCYREGVLEDFRLRIFMAVAEKGSFTLAAKALGVSQPAVSQNIAELEKSLGAELFLRRKGSVTLTPKGAAFKEYAGRILYWYTATEMMFGPEGKLSANKPIRTLRRRIHRQPYSPPGAFKTSGLQSVPDFLHPQRIFRK